MKTGNEIAMMGMLLLLSACGGSPGADPDASTPAAQQGAETAKAGASTAEAPADGAASGTAADTATADAPANGAASGKAADTATAEVPADGAASGTVADTAAAAQDDSAVTAQIESLLGGADEYKAAFKALQTAVAANDKAAVARLVDYPFDAAVGRKRTIKNADQFVQEYDQIITPAIAAVITRQKFADLFVNDKGVMIGNGEVWISGVCSDEACSKQTVSITAIQDTDSLN